MSKSIERMWKESFATEGDLIAPKITDLYNRKSQNIVDKLLSMFNMNLKAIFIGSAIMLVFMTLIGAPLLGIYMCCLLVPLVLIAKKEIKKSSQLSKGQSSYDYLINFDTWLKSSIKNIASYYRLFYPLLFLGIAIQCIASNAGGELMALLIKSFPTEMVVFGVPYYALCIIALITFVIAKYSETFYRWDIEIVYGTQFKKLEELIADMKALRNGV